MNIEKRVVFNNCIIDNDDLWGWDINYNALFKIERTKAIITRKTPFLDRGIYTGSLYSKIVRYESKIIAVPQKGTQILIYDIETEEIRYVDIHSIISKYEYNSCGSFWDAIVDGENVYFIGYTIPLILKFDMRNEMIISTIDLYENNHRTESVVYFKEAIILDNKLFIPACEDNSVFIVDLNLESFKIKIISNVIGGFCSLTYENQNIWLFPRRRGPVIKWNLPSDDIEQYKDYPREFEFVGERASLGVSIDNDLSIMGFPLNSNNVIIIDKKTGQMEVEKEFSKYINSLTDNEKTVAKFCMINKIGSQIICSTLARRDIIFYDLKRKDMKIVSYEISEEDYNYYKALEMCENYRIVSEESYSLNRFLSIIRSLDTYKYKKEQDREVGRSIHKQLIEDIIQAH